MNKRNKQFLYLVQARAKLAKRNLSLESDRSDVLIYSFEKKLDIAGSLYKPNTLWGEGRNILIETAREMKQKYHYYVLMDDDVDFVKGSFKEFEDEVLKIKPDFCTPFYYSPENRVPSHYPKTKSILFRYSAFRVYDDCMTCFSRRFFLDENLLPYHTSFYKNPFYHNSFYPPFILWDRVLARKKRRNKNRGEKVLCISSLVHTNLSLGSHYNYRFRTSQLFARIYGRKWQGLCHFHREIASQRYLTIISMLSYRRYHYDNIIKKIRLKDILLGNVNRKRYIKYYYRYILFRLYGSYVARKERLRNSFWIAAVIGLYRDIKLNLFLHRK